MLSKQKAVENTTRYRNNLRKKGLRPVQLWTYDTKNPAFLKMLNEQCKSLKNDPLEEDILSFTEAALAEVEDWK